MPDRRPFEEPQSPDASADELGVDGVRGPQNFPRSDGPAATSNHPTNWSRFKLGFEEAETGDTERRYDDSPGPSPRRMRDHNAR